MPPRPGAVERYDHICVRSGVASLVLAREPLADWRPVRVTAHRGCVEWAHDVRDLLDGRDRDADCLTLIIDQLDTRSAASPDEAFSAEDAQGLAEQPDIHRTPKHASWLSMAAIALSALARQALSCRLARQHRRERRDADWEVERNAAGTTIDWQFTTEGARIKPRSLYPSF